MIAFYDFPDSYPIHALPFLVPIKLNAFNSDTIFLLTLFELI